MALDFWLKRSEERRQDQRRLDAVIREEQAIQNAKMLKSKEGWFEYHRTSSAIGKAIIITKMLWQNTDFRTFLVTTSSTVAGVLIVKILFGKAL